MQNNKTSKKLQRIVRNAQKRDYVRFTRRKKFVALSSGIILGSGIIAGAAYGFYSLSQEDTRPKFASLSINSNDEILSNEPFCGTVLNNGIPAPSCYANQMRLTSAYGGLISKDELETMAAWMKSSLFHGPEAALVTNVVFQAGANTRDTLKRSWTSKVITKESTTISIFPDAEDTLNNSAAKTLNETVIKTIDKKSNKTILEQVKLLASDFLILLEAMNNDTTFIKDTAFNNLLIATKTLSQWDDSRKDTNYNFLQTIYHLLYRSAVSKIESNDLNGKINLLPSAPFKSNSGSLPEGSLDLIYDRALVSALIQGNDPMFVNSEGKFLKNYYKEKNIDFDTDSVLALKNIKALSSSFFPGNSPIFTSIGYGVTSNASISNSALVSTIDKIDEFVRNHLQISGKNSVDLLKPFINELTQNKLLNKMAFLSMSAQNQTSDNLLRKATVLGENNLMALLFPNSLEIARRLTSATKPNVSLNFADISDVFSYQLPNSEILKFSPNAKTLADSFISGQWYQDEQFFSTFKATLQNVTFSNLLSSFVNEYYTHLFARKSLDYFRSNAIPVFEPLTMISTMLNQQIYFNFFNTLSGGANLENIGSEPVTSNIYARDQIAVANDASSLTTTTPTILYNPLKISAPYIKSNSDVFYLNDLVAKDNWQLWVLGAKNSSVEPSKIINYVDVLNKIINKAYDSSWVNDALEEYSASKTVLTLASNNDPTTDTLVSSVPQTAQDLVNAIYGLNAVTQKAEALKMINDALNEISKPIATRNLNKVAYYANLFIRKVYMDSLKNSLFTSSITDDLPKILNTSYNLHFKSDLTKTKDVTIKANLIAENNSVKVFLSDYFSQTNTNINIDKPVSPFLKQANFSGIAAGRGLATEIDIPTNESIFTAPRIFSFILQLLTLDVSENISTNSYTINKNIVEQSNILLNSLGIEIYDGTTGLLTEIGKKMLDFYRQTSGLVVDSQTHTVVDAEQIHEINWLRANENYEMNGWIPAADKEKTKYLKFTNENGKSTYSKIYFSNISNYTYFDEIYRADTNGKYTRKIESKKTNFSENFIRWQSDYMPIGNYSNVNLNLGKHKISFTSDTNGSDEVIITKLKSNDVFNKIDDTKHQIQYNNNDPRTVNIFVAFEEASVFLKVEG